MKLKTLRGTGACSTRSRDQGNNVSRKTCPKSTPMAVPAMDNLPSHLHTAKIIGICATENRGIEKKILEVEKLKHNVTNLSDKHQ